MCALRKKPLALPTEELSVALKKKNNPNYGALIFASDNSK